MDLCFCAGNAFVRLRFGVWRAQIERRRRMHRCGETARQIAYWRDGAWVSKTAALEAEVTSGGPHTEAYELALTLRREGSAACDRESASLRRQMQTFAADVRADLSRLLERGAAGNRKHPS